MEIGQSSMEGMGMKILVTGATGFVGSHLTEELISRGADVTATTHNPINSKSYFATKKLEKKCRVVKIELTDFKSVRNLITNNSPASPTGGQLTTHNYYDFIFHLAAQPLVDVAYDDPKTTLYSNILGTINILESARLVGNIKGIIVASSDKAYGKLKSKVKSLRQRRIWAKGPSASGRSLWLKKSNLKYQEFYPLSGDHPYEVSKSSTDLIACSYFKTYGLPVVVTRFGNIYGEGDIHFSRLVPGIMKAMVNKETFDIRSNGKFVRDYLYVKDVVRGYLILAKNIKKIKGEAFNFGSDDTYSVLSLISLVSRITRTPLKNKILNTAKNEIPYQSLDWSKIKKTVGWKPEYDLKSTISAIYRWYANYFH